MTTRLYTHADCANHLNMPGHPERPERLSAIHDALAMPEFDFLERRDAPLADPESFKLAHPASHVERVASLIPTEGLAVIDADTSASSGSWQAARRAVGAALEGVDAVFAGEVSNVFAAVRPPGHHAEKSTAMGFCLVNTAAIAARHAIARHGAQRVAIVDFDGHHGNGTQDIFWDDRNVLFASSHQMPLYPGTGALSETGAGNIHNAPLREGDDGDHFRQAWREKLLPAIDNFGPDLIIVSAGFDAHYRDPLAGLRLTTRDFDWITGKLMDQADKHAGGRLVSLLEGGYDLQGLAESAAAHVNRLMNA